MSANSQQGLTGSTGLWRKVSCCHERGRGCEEQSSGPPLPPSHLSHCPPVLLSRTVLAFLGDSFMSVIVVFPTVHEGIVLLL